MGVILKVGMVNFLAHKAHHLAPPPPPPHFTKVIYTLVKNVGTEVQTPHILPEPSFPIGFMYWSLSLGAYIPDMVFVTCAVDVLTAVNDGSILTPPFSRYVIVLLVEPNMVVVMTEDEVGVGHSVVAV